MIPISSKIRKITALLALVAQPVVGEYVSVQVIRVIDGDTIVVAAPWVPDPLKKEISLRLFGVDTPEKGFRAKCEQESILAQSATDYVTSKISTAKEIKAELIDWDKYSGRILASVQVDGIDLRQQLLAQHYAREYHGGAKQSWCEHYH